LARFLFSWFFRFVVCCYNEFFSVGGEMSQRKAKKELQAPTSPSSSEKLFIDDTIEVVRSHVDKRGWTNTFNVWAGEGGWRSPAARIFRVSGVPTTHIIDARGKIIRAEAPRAELSEILQKSQKEGT